VAITDVALLNEAGAQRTVFDHGERMRVRFAYAWESTVEAPHFIVAVTRSDGVACCSYSSDLDGASLPPVARSATVELLTPPLALVSELYSVEILVRERGSQKLLGAATAGRFHVRDPMVDAPFGVFREPGRWEVLRPSLAERGDAVPVRVAS
jgi:lipopolysaccharide transport system ATP-binding protein